MLSLSYLLVVRRPAGGFPLVNCRLFIEYDTCTAGWLSLRWLLRLIVHHCYLSGAISSDCRVVIHCSSPLVSCNTVLSYFLLSVFSRNAIDCRLHVLLLSVCFVIYWQWVFIAFYLHIVYLCVVTTDTTRKHFTWMRVSVVCSSSYLWTVYSLHLYLFGRWAR